MCVVLFTLPSNSTYLNLLSLLFVHRRSSSRWEINTFRPINSSYNLSGKLPTPLFLLFLSTRYVVGKFSANVILCVNRRILRDKYSQKPQLSSSHKIVRLAFYTVITPSCSLNTHFMLVGYDSRLYFIKQGVLWTCRDDFNEMYLANLFVVCCTASSRCIFLYDLCTSCMYVLTHVVINVALRNLLEMLKLERVGFITRCGL